MNSSQLKSARTLSQEEAQTPSSSADEQTPLLPFHQTQPNHRFLGIPIPLWLLSLPRRYIAILIDNLGSSTGSTPTAINQSARDLQVQGSILSGECYDGSAWVPSEIDLNRYLGNINGSFRWREPRWSLTAQQVVLNETVLHASLRTRDGRWVPSQIDLSQRIKNIRGYLTYQ
jgi:hypothetical protein